MDSRASLRHRNTPNWPNVRRTRLSVTFCHSLSTESLSATPRVGAARAMHLPSSHQNGAIDIQLFGEFQLAPRAIQQPEEPHQPAAYLSNVHHDSCGGTKKRARIAVVVSHLRVSWASRLCPARVSL